MLAPWVVDELETVDLQDKRLNRRLQEVLDQLAARPTASIPAAYGGGRAEVEAVYRFFANDKVTFDEVLRPHIDATEKRLAEQPMVILAQDTTEIDLTRPEKQVAGAGPLDGSSRWGVLLHEMHAFTPHGTPLGTVHAVPWTRDKDGPRTALLSRAQRARTPIEEKESHRWVVAMRQARAVAERHPQTQVVCVADSEADVYELLAEATSGPPKIDWIVRACQNRALRAESSAVEEEDRTADHLREVLLKQPVLFTKKVTVRSRRPKVSCETRGRRQPRIPREAEVEVRAAVVTLRPPWRADRELPEVTVHVVLVREQNPPGGDEPVEWLLLTSLPTGDPPPEAPRNATTTGRNGAHGGPVGRLCASPARRPTGPANALAGPAAPP